VRKERDGMGGERRGREGKGGERRLKTGPPWSPKPSYAAGRQSNHVIKLQNFHYVIFNAQKEQCHHSALGHNSAQFVLHMFQC